MTCAKDTPERADIARRGIDAEGWGIGMRTLVVAVLTLIVVLMLAESGPGLDRSQILFAISCAIVAAIAYSRVRRRAR